MATTPNSLSPLPSRTDGLGIFPSGDSLSRTSIYSYGHTRSSTCTVLSYAQQSDQDKTSSPAGSITRTTTIRTNLKEIQKSPLPHRFNLVPSSRKRVPEQPSQIPRSATQWTWKRGHEAVESNHSIRSPSLYATSPDPQSTQFAQDSNEEKRAILEDLLSDALDSPVFECSATFSPPCTPSPQTQTVSPPSFTLVQDQPIHKYRHFSTASDSIRELQASADSRQPPVDRDPRPSPASPSPLPTTPAASTRGGAQFYEDFQPSPVTPEDIFDTYLEDTPQSTSIHQRSYGLFQSSRATPSASSSSREFFIHGGVDTSGSTYSQLSPDNSFGAATGHGDQLQAASRRATDGSIASLASSDSRRRKFAVRRQAIYAEYGFKLAFPDSDSASSIRHTHIPTSSSRDFAEAGSSRAASVYVGSRSVWSASTSAASIRSRLQDDVDAEGADEPRDSEHSFPPYPPARSLANLSNIECLSVQDAFLSSSRNPLLDEHADLMTSTPPAKPRSQAKHSASLNGVSTHPVSLSEVDGGCRKTGAPIYACGLEWQPWPPLRLPAIDSENGCGLIRRSSSALERAQMFAKWQGGPGHHPIVQDLLNAVDVAIREWNRGLFVIVE